MALSLGSPPPEVIRHRLSMEPGLSSPSDDGAAARPADPGHGLRRGGRGVKARGKLYASASIASQSSSETTFTP
ncbi:hypothetical protein Y590_23748 [Methylobacterium sp. AMS5]|nr:hypothetical protein Y590_23748 [Methylobacterium sp. AMS5]